MSVLKGKLRTGLDTPGISGLVRYLTDAGRLYIQLVDSDGNTVSESGACPGACRAHCEKTRQRLAQELAETQQDCSATCHAGSKVSALPLTHSSAFFGSVLVCEPSKDRRQYTAGPTSVAGGSVPDVESGQTMTYVDPLVNSLASLVARDSFHELELESLTSDLALRYEELALLYEIGERIPIRAQTPTVINYIVESLKEVVRCDVVCWVPQGKSPSTVYWVQDSRGGEEIEDKIRRIGAEINRRAEDKKSLLTINDLGADPVLKDLASDISAASGYPVATEDEHFGTLVLFKLQSGKFKSGEAMLVSAVTRRSGTVIRNAKLYQELNGLFLNTIRALVRIIEGKDAYTRSHSERVNAFSMQLAVFLRLPSGEKEALSWSSMLHDIGKIKVPEEILKKPGRLTEEEFAVIKKHPGFGADMLSPISQFSHCLPDIRHHHERIDGAGYPDRLIGDEIPLRARIIAVADTFDALTSDRCYRPRFDVEKALEIVAEVAGTQLYPEAAMILVENKDAFLEHLQSPGTEQQLVAV